MKKQALSVSSGGREKWRGTVLKVRTCLTCLRNFKLAGAEWVGGRGAGNEIREIARGQILQVKVRTWNFFSKYNGQHWRTLRWEATRPGVSWAAVWRACFKWGRETQLLKPLVWGCCFPPRGSFQESSQPFQLLNILCSPFWAPGSRASRFAVLSVRLRQHCFYSLQEWVDVLTSVKR